MTNSKELAEAVATHLMHLLDERLPRLEQAGPEYLTLHEVAQRTSFSYDFIYNAVRSGELPAVQKGREWRVKLTDMRSWMDRDRAGQVRPARKGMREKIDRLMPRLKV
jgi:excisionase family DNA binding protein